MLPILFVSQKIVDEFLWFFWRSPTNHSISMLIRITVRIEECLPEYRCGSHLWEFCGISCLGGGWRCPEFVFFVFCLLVVLVRLSVPVQVIDWKDSSPKWHNALTGTLNPTHSHIISLVNKMNIYPGQRRGLIDHYCLLCLTLITSSNKLWTV